MASAPDSGAPERAGLRAGDPPVLTLVCEVAASGLDRPARDNASPRTGSV